MPDFVPGLALARDFYAEVVAPHVTVPHAAALLGEGSDVLGYDQPRSTDHSWGPRLQIFVAASEVSALSCSLEPILPVRFRGWPVRFQCWKTGKVRHHVDVTTLAAWGSAQLGIAPFPQVFSTAQWLAFPQQSLLEVTSGAVFFDNVGELSRLRESLAFYPKDVWLWAMAVQWHLIAGGEARLGRVTEAGDRRGAALIAARLGRLVMELGFLQMRRYWPYEKWFGTAFARLPVAATLEPPLDALLSAEGFKEQQNALHSAVSIVAAQHNSLGVTAPVAPGVAPFQVGINNAVRPYLVFNARGFESACRLKISDTALRDLPLTGTFDQLTHGDDELVNFSSWPRLLREVYDQQMKAAAQSAP